LSNILWDVKDTANYLDVSIYTIYRYAECGQLPHIKKNFGLRFRKEDLDAWLDGDKRKVIAPNHFFQDKLTHPPKILIKNMGGVSSEMAKSKSKTRYNFGYGAIYTRRTKSGKVRWYLDYRDATRKRVQKVVAHATSPEEAQIALQREVSKTFSQEYGIKSQKERISFREFSNIYLENYAIIRKRSWKSDQKYLRAQLIPFFGDFQLHEITPLNVSQFIVKRQKDGVRKSTINRELTVLKKMLNLAIEWNFEIAKNPVVKGNYFAEDEYKRNRVLVSDEEERLFQAAAPHLKLILICALNTGMRYSEILGLTWESLDPEKRQIIVQANSSKSGKARVIPINSTLYSTLAQLKEKSNGYCGNVFLYDDPVTGESRAVKTVRRAFLMACRRARIKNLRFHDLRHTFGSRLIERGADPVSVKNLLGHANLKTTEVYLHSSLGQMKNAVDLLDPKPVRTSEKDQSLLHICDTESQKKRASLLNDYFSGN
jgi:integrase